MRWIKKGRIYVVAHHSDWAFSHAHKPTVYLVDENRLRIFFGTRNEEKRTVTTFIDVDPERPEKILYEHDKPVLGLGKLGCFDDAGVNVSCIVKKDDLLYMYYIGWNTSTTVPHRNSIGLAVSKDNGLTFKRLFEGPIMDRTTVEPYFTTAPYVIIEGKIWRMWYTSGTEWRLINGQPEICYHIKYAESTDGIHWIRKNISCIKPKNPEEVTARPCVLLEDGKYKMWYSYRSIENFRTDRAKSYRIGYAESTDGISWERKDEEVGIDISNHGWDSMMIEYPAVYKYRGKKYMLYNGNNFGASGFGYAILSEE